MVNRRRRIVHPKPDRLRNRRDRVIELSMTIYAGARGTVRTVDSGPASARTILPTGEHPLSLYRFQWPGRVPKPKAAGVLLEALEACAGSCDTRGRGIVVTPDAHFDEGVEGSALVWIAANPVEDDAVPTDLADEHDHYLDGRPKKDSGARN